MRTAEEILKEYVTYEDVNSTEVTLYPFTILDMMEEYGKELIHETVKRCASNAKLNIIPIKDNVGYRYNTEVNKESILKIESEMIKEL